MKIYLVGGAVRDELLGKTPKDKDYVVVGATRDDMLKNGFLQVGQDFPVFLHPDTKEEYALARTERKVGKGYKGFTFSTEFVSLEEDLKRRDITINAIAKDIDTGEVIDPYNGIKDLEKRCIRHVSDSFKEDPLRVLRVARFYSKLSSLGFMVADDTVRMISSMVFDGMLSELNAERVFSEVDKTLDTENPSLFFYFLKDVKGLEYWFSEILELFSLDSKTLEIKTKSISKYNLGDTTLNALSKIANYNVSKEIKYSVLCHKLYALENIKKNDKTKKRTCSFVKKISNRLKTPRSWFKVAEVFCNYHASINEAFLLRDKDILSLFQETGALKNTDLFSEILFVCGVIFRSSNDNKDCLYSQNNYLAYILSAVNDINIKDIVKDNKGNGEMIKKAILATRLEKINKSMSEYKSMYYLK